MEKFIKKLCERHNLPEKDVRTLIDNMQEVPFKKREIIVKEGEKNSNLYIIKRGIWRGYYFKDGVDSTIWFASEVEAVFSIWSYAENIPSRINIEAMSDSIAYCIPGALLKELSATSLGIANISRRLMESDLLSIENWLIDSGQPKAMERYTTLLKKTPELLKYVPLKHIASYLWVTPQSLSRLRRNIK